MEAIRGFLGWFSKQKLSGKLFIVCSSLFLFFRLCNIPMASLSPSTFATTPNETPTPILATDTQVPEPYTPTPLSTTTLMATLLPTATNTQTILGVSCIPNNAFQIGKVVDVVDGDTIKVLLDQDGRTYTVRYIGISAPSYVPIEFFGSEAAVKNVELVFGKNVTLIKEVTEKDNLGRLLRYVIVDNIFVNYELVAQGYARTVSTPPDIACIPAFEEVEQKASSSKLGLWNVLPTFVVNPTSSNNPNSSGNFDNNGDSNVTCADFQTQAQALAALRAGYTNLDSDSDGVPCESLP